MDIPEKPRKHPWVTKTVKAKIDVLSVWPSEEDFSTPSKQEKFLETIVKIGNDPRVVKIEKVPHETHGCVFLFKLNNGPLSSND